MRNVTPSFRDATAFLSLLGTEHVTFQSFDDNADRKDPALAGILHGTLREHFNDLAALNQRGAGIFFMVQEGNGTGRNNAAVTAIRAVFQEDDGEGKELPLVPHIVVESSPGRYHRYLLADGLSTEDFRSVQERLIADYGSDKAAKDFARVLRVPGFYHQKIDGRKGLSGAPHLVRVVQESHARHYVRDEVLTALPPIPHNGSKHHSASGSPGTNGHDKQLLEDLRAALSNLRPSART
jgi:RepB DNA-primase N-terminal domain